jgi:hypothetical protein
MRAIQEKEWSSQPTIPAMGYFTLLWLQVKARPFPFI